jgi:hypothetical protein
MQETDVWRRFGNNLAVEFEHESQNAVSSRVRWTHIKNHLFADVVIAGVPQLRVRCDYSCHRIRRFNLTCREGHGKKLQGYIGYPPQPGKTDNIYAGE